MAWPKLRNHTSPEPSATSGNSGERTWPHPVTPDRDRKPTYRAHQGWPGEQPTESGGDAPFWENWKPADESFELDDPGDGLPEEGYADDAVTDVDPRPRHSWRSEERRGGKE